MEQPAGPLSDRGPPVDYCRTECKFTIEGPLHYHEMCFKKLVDKLAGDNKEEGQGQCFRHKSTMNCF